MDDMSCIETNGDRLAIQNDTSPHQKTSIEHAGESENGDYVSWTLQFLASASTETLAGIAVGLGACTYLVLGRIGLVLIGVTAGVVLHATWEKQGGLSTEDDRREKGLDVIRRILRSRSETISRTVGTNEKEHDSVTTRDFFQGFRPETTLALNDLVDAVIRDYVKWWYQPILPSESSFPQASRRTLVGFITSISQHLSKKRPADSFLDFLTNSSSIIIVFLNELASALAQGESSSPAEAVHTYLSANPDSSLANVLSQEQQTKKFRIIADDILQNFIDKNTYECYPARTFLKEILAGVVLESTLKTCSKPEWINGWIVYLLENGEPDFNQAIDAGMGVEKEPLSSLTDIDGNMGNVSLAKPKKLKSETQSKQEVQRHKKRLSKAEEAMEEAMEEAKRLSQLMLEEDERRKISNDDMKLNKAPVNKNDGEDNPSKQLDRLASQQSLVAQTDSYSAMEARPIKAEAAPPLPDRPLVAAKPEGISAETHDSNMPAHLLQSLASVDNTGAVKGSQPRSAFTSFDQIIPSSPPPLPRRPTMTLTLLNASITIYDDSTPNEKGKLRAKPTVDYLIQIEPSSSQHPGWMIARFYRDFETLHEVLRRIAQISGVAAFTEQHNALPSWKEHTKASLRGELERYLREALWYQPLAESEGMKRFLEKDQGHSSSASKPSGSLGWPTPSAFEAMGKGMLDVLTSAPKGVAEGGKAIGGGITGVFNNIGNLAQKKPVPPNNPSQAINLSSTASTLPRAESVTSLSGSRKSRASEDSLRTGIVQTQPAMIAPMERRPSYHSIAEDDPDRRGSMSARSSMSGRRSVPQSRASSRAPSIRGTPISSPTHNLAAEFKLPPLPTDIPDDYGSAFANVHSRTESSATTVLTPTSTVPSQQSPRRSSLSANREEILLTQAPARKTRKESAPLSEGETRVAVELLFAVINELYTLSSAWNIRRTLLAAAKTFLLRPGNPSLSSIQSLIQDSVIASNTSDAGIAAHLRKLRENVLPTVEELKLWPTEMSSDEKERLRVKARRLLVERGVPAALTGVMGNAATAEAMGKLFDCLQVEEVARGLIFGLLLQSVRVVVQ